MGFTEASMKVKEYTRGRRDIRRISRCSRGVFHALKCEEKVRRVEEEVKQKDMTKRMREMEATVTLMSGEGERGEAIVFKGACGVDDVAGGSLSIVGDSIPLASPPLF